MRVAHTLSVLGVAAVTAFVPKANVYRHAGVGSLLAEKTEFGFDELRSLESRLDKLDQNAPDLLGNFYEHHLKSFSILPGSVTRLSVMSTCYALQSILAAGDSGLYDSFIVKGTVADPSDTTRTSTGAILAEMLASEWREDDLFQIPVLLYTILKVDTDRLQLNKAFRDNPAIASKVRRIIASVVAARPQRRAAESQKYSDYIIFQCCQVFCLLHDTSVKQQRAVANVDGVVPVKAVEQFSLGGLSADALPEDAAFEIPLALTRCAEISFNELCRQLAYRSVLETHLPLM
jgi:hypothetical protein